MKIDTILVGNVLERIKEIPDASVDCVVTSPPYYSQRDYEVEGQIGLEESPERYVETLSKVFDEVYRVLKPEGTLWLNLGDTYWGGKGRSGQSDARKQLGMVQAGESLNAPQAHTGGKGITRPIDGKHPLIKPKDLIGIPWMVAFELRNRGWVLRQDIIWSKLGCTPSPVQDRCTTSHEYIFLMAKQRHYYFDYRSIMEPAAYDGRKDTRLKINPKYAQQEADDAPSQTRGIERWSKDEDGNYVRRKRSVWSVAPRKEPDAHFATFPERLITDCIKAGCPKGGVVLDPFFGSGTTGIVARKLNRHFIGIELNPAYVKIAQKKFLQELADQTPPQVIH